MTLAMVARAWSCQNARGDRVRLWGHRSHISPDLRDRATSLNTNFAHPPPGFWKKSKMSRDDTATSSWMCGIVRALGLMTTSVVNFDNQGPGILVLPSCVVTRYSTTWFPEPSVADMTAVD